MDGVYGYIELRRKINIELELVIVIKITTHNPRSGFRFNKFTKSNIVKVMEITKIWHKNHTLTDGRLTVGYFKVPLSRISGVGLWTANAPVQEYRMQARSPYSWPKRWFVSNPNPYTTHYCHGYSWDRKFYPYEWESERLRVWFDGNVVDIVRKVDIKDVPEDSYDIAVARLEAENEIIMDLYKKLDALGIPLV